MSSTIATSPSRAATTTDRSGLFSKLFAGRRGRRLRETLLAYAFLFPAFLIISVFGLFPLIFAAYQSSLRGLNKIVGTYDGLGNYVRAIDSLTYVLAFWIAAVALFVAIRTLIVTAKNAAEKRHQPWLWLIPGTLIGSGFALFIGFIFRLLPALLDVPNQLRGRNADDATFRGLMWDAWMQGPVQQFFWGALLLIIVGIVLTNWIDRSKALRARVGNYAGPFISVTILFIGAAVLGWLTWTEVQAAYAEALEAGEGLDLWTQIITISAGFLLLIAAWWLWDNAGGFQSNLAMAARLCGAAVLMVGGWVLIGELPRVIAAGDKDWWIGLLATVWYSIGTVPTQLIISLVLAVLLFQDIKGKGFFRMVYFIPYIAPFVGTAAVFRIIFSSRPNALLNSTIGVLGIDPALWLSEPKGIFQLLLGNSVQLPIWAAGPSLALVVIMIYGIWTFVGFNTVVFLAGLGNIPKPLYEAAAIDGGGRWAQFRNITLPLLSPTIYFLTLYSVIGTFKAFNHLYVLRNAAALGTTDTASIVIFEAFKRDTRYGYASALAILLLIIILILTYVNNRIASKRVFYG
ncbi:MAG TPA: sugar ABC transporter permease [Caldilineaceae bacterium]|nr:sugar ABC transporter permease [Caldilineaceae bacterium]